MIEENAPRKRIRGVQPVVQLMAQDLRQSSTPAEALLWEALRGRKLEGIKFRRQQAIGRFIADFFSSEHKFIIELDGNVHNTEHAAEYDDVLADLSTVLEKSPKR